MKFDVSLSNPPYTSGDTILYSKFFKTVLYLADTVYMIMPHSPLSKQVRVAKHNRLVEKHKFFQSKNISEHFNVNLTNIFVLGCKLSHTADISWMDRDPLDLVPIHYPNRTRITPKRGYGPYSRQENICTTGSKIWGRISDMHDLEFAYMNPDVEIKGRKKCFLPHDWLVFVNECPSQGVFKTAVTPNIGLSWRSGLFAIGCDSKKEAEELVKWLESDEIIAMVNEMLDAKNTWSFSGQMMQRLPWYK